MSMDLSIVSADPNDPYARIRRGLPNLGPPPPDIAGPGHLGEDVNLGIPSVFKSQPSPQIKAPRGTVEGDQARYTDIASRPAALEQVRSRIEGSNFGQEHPTAGKILGWAAQIPASIADIGLSAATPRLGAAVPGTTLNRGLKLGNLEEMIGKEQEGREKEAQAENEQARTAQIGNEPEQHKQDLLAQLAPHGLTLDDSGKITAVPEDQLPADVRAKIQGQWKPVAGVAGRNGEPMEFNEATGLYRAAPGAEGASLVSTDKTAGGVKGKLQQDLVDAYNRGDQATVAKLRQQLKDIDPAAEQRFSFDVTKFGQTETDKQNQFNRQDVREHDKAYVQPAEAVEKSYDMMDNAYREYKAAQAKGQQLPTGAQSMVALSTHLATTFGNVKGARVTKDMIHEHLGARSIPDEAVVAVQRLTNGDQLSPGQWDAFHDLIKQSRNLSWATAVKEGTRKHIPIDFLPPDLQTIQRSDGAYKIGDDGQYHKVTQ